MNDYMELREHLAHASRAGMPANVPSYYRGKSNVSTSTVNDQARYKAFLDFQEKLTNYKLQLADVVDKIKEAKPYYEAYPNLLSEQAKLEKLVARYEGYVRNTNDTRSLRDIKSDQDRQDRVAGAANNAANFVKSVVTDVASQYIPKNIPGANPLPLSTYKNYTTKDTGYSKTGLYTNRKRSGGGSYKSKSRSGGGGRM